MTDDQTAESMRALPLVQELVGAEGTTFSNSVVSFPVCCPSRATFLTGQYMHNHGVRGNLPPHGGFGAFEDQGTTFPVALQQAGYDTIHIGKYLNGYGVDAPAEVPPGWDEWHGSVDPSTYQYTGYSLLENGVIRTHDGYQTDVFTDVAIEAVRQRADGDRPFFLSVAYLAPHAAAREGSEEVEITSAEPAPRHLGTYEDEPLPEDEAYNEADVSDKPESVSSLPSITTEVAATMTESYDRYLESLMAVDEGVEKILSALDDAGILDDTVVIFTSDNGYLFGEHRIPSGKSWFYEPSIRVPLLVRGPGIQRGVTSDALVANTDLAPTILDLAGATSMRTVDGISLVPLLQGGDSPTNRVILLESGGPVFPNRGLRSERYAYFELGTGEVELYDLMTDPSQLDNRHGDPALAQVEASLAADLASLSTCAGDTCR